MIRLLRGRPSRLLVRRRVALDPFPGSKPSLSSSTRNLPCVSASKPLVRWSHWRAKIECPHCGAAFAPPATTSASAKIPSAVNASHPLHEAKKKLLIAVCAVACLCGLWVLSRKVKSPKQYFDEVVDDIFDKCDVDGSHTVDETELYVAILLVYSEINSRFPGHLEPPSAEDVAEAFHRFDLDGSGSLDRNEFRQFAKNLGDVNGEYVKHLSRQVAWTCAALPAAAFGLKRLAMLRFPKADNIPIFLAAPVLGGVVGGFMALVPCKPTENRNLLLPARITRQVRADPTAVSK
mmetsp:Transcript_68256/g.160518  ORF Transcript_68256/g.160518 Transcript_68256/m.160518 type:complete len:292 (-) Transcript_68256:1182-2057(-)